MVFAEHRDRNGPGNDGEYAEEMHFVFVNAGEWRYFLEAYVCDAVQLSVNSGYYMKFLGLS
jgi:hypothetical protein